MPGIHRLIEQLVPIESAGRGRDALDWFVAHQDCDLLAVAEAGQPLGVIARGAVDFSTADRSAIEIMSAAPIVGSQAEIDEACALLLAHPAPAAGLIVVEAGAYVGVVSVRALLRAKCELTLAADSRRGFVELISRELRSPMNGVLAVAELLQRQPLPVDAKPFVRTIIESCHGMVTALDDALELSRAEAGEMTLDPRPVRLRELMDGVQDRWHERAAQDGVNLAVAYDGEPELMAELDPARVEQVFDGLISVALTQSRQDAIEASLTAHRSGIGLRLTGRVRDTGGAFAASGLGARGSRGGAKPGIGVTLCRRIVERLGGEIRLEANIGAGATIVFDFPAAEAIADSDVATTVAAKRAAHVLVVDDNATNRMVAEALCEMFDCTSECAEDGVEAVEAARSGRFDLILMDIRMPRMDGVEATRAIRALPEPCGAVPIIALTANADPEDAKAYIACGMHSVVEKPIKPERLLQAINAALPDIASDRAAAA
jgi:CheY-like chemotaxis protein